MQEYAGGFLNVCQCHCHAFPLVFFNYARASATLSWLWGGVGRAATAKLLRH